jgi:glycosyltransferase involved in cell wall biosynthesis
VQAGVGQLDQYRIVPNGVDLNRFAGAWSPVPGRILMVGRLAAPKRPDLALRALARVRARVPAAELHLAGDGPLEPEARALARELGIEDAVRFLGRRDDVAALLREAAVALLASDYEGSPLSVIEAMATGVPVVATAAGGVDELVVDGTTGVLAPPRDADALGEALVRVLSDPAAGAAMGAAGKRAAHERLSTERMVAETVALYEEALADSG